SVAICCFRISSFAAFIACNALSAVCAEAVVTAAATGLCVVEGVIAGTTIGIGVCADAIEPTTAIRERISARMLSPPARIDFRQADRFCDRRQLFVDLFLIVRNGSLLALHFLGKRDDLLLVAIGFFGRFRGGGAGSECEHANRNES